MALFAVPRYVSDEEDNPEHKPQLLLHRLQEQARTRQLQKQEQNWTTSDQLKRLEPEISEEEAEKELKKTTKKREVSQESPLAQSHRAKGRRQHACGEGSFPKKGDGSSRSKKNGGKSRMPQGRTEAVQVQAEVIPAILECGPNGALAGRGGYQPRDICVSAPTGSGKTLAFVIPVVQALLDRIVCHVRALAVLPTKELAQQVTKVFNIYTDGTGLKVVQLTGQKSFVKEQESLVESTLMGLRSLADIVVATPGRLVDHLQQSPQFSLRELRFLIIDEADRMIDNMHQDWLQQVVEAVYRAEEGVGPSRLFRRVQLNPSTAARACCPQLPLQKLLFSATLTQNPEKLQQLGLHQPRLFTPARSGKGADALGSQPCSREKYILPEGLSQYYVPCSLNWKPLFLLHFLARLKFPQVLCFTNSKETSHRLFLLIRAFGGVNVAEFSSKLSPSKRKLTLKEFEQGKIQLLISTDATARGIDFDGVKCVVSYDAPQFIRTYVHRVGRTARAGKAGLAFTMLLKRQEYKFLKMLKDAGLPELQPQLVKSTSIQPLLQQYEEALAELAHAVKEEQAGKRS
ncbi:ATP-dependent RNA helicase DDX51 isoform X2 [Candoia aspera]|uniref:ATP-dependent RNA helicase DDX51 isoform X2 n=1 Tax=Candoia aspera TaxID=51853 RepID=UPI002FD7CD36